MGQKESTFKTKWGERAAILVGLVIIFFIGKYIYTTYIAAPELPEDPRFMTTEQLKTIPQMTGQEFAEKSLDKSLDGEYVIITDLYSYGQLDQERMMVECYGTDGYYPFIVNFGGDGKNLFDFVMSRPLEETKMIVGKVIYDEDSEICYINNAWIIDSNYTLPYSDIVVNSVS